MSFSCPILDSALDMHGTMHLRGRLLLNRSLAMLFLLSVPMLSTDAKANAKPEPAALPGGSYPEGLYNKAIVTQPAPNFDGTAVVNRKLVKISLAQFHGRYVVLLFYALDFSSVCPTEITAFSDNIDEFRKHNAEVIACSVDSPFAHLTWMRLPRREGGLGTNIRIPMLSDLTHQISRDYGVYMPHLGHSLRALFIIDGRANIRQIMINDLSVARSVDEVLRLVKAFQHVDKTGNACPANWQPKSRGIVNRPQQPRQYPATRHIYI